MTKISFEEFVDQYKPEVNKFDGNASFDGYMFETFGEEEEYAQEKAKVGHTWTLIEDEGEMFITHGYQHVNRLGYFVTKYAPRFDNICVVVNDMTEEDEQTADAIEKRYQKALKEFEDTKKAYKTLKRKEFLKKALPLIKDEELLDAIESFGAVEAYPQTDVFIYDGYRTWADSIIFRNWDGEEKAVVVDTDDDFDIDRISVAHKSDISIFFENEDGDELTDIYQNLLNIPHDPIILEKEETVK